MSSTAVLVHTSSRALDNAERIARVAAAGRVQVARIAAERAALMAERKALASATEWVEDIAALGAVEVGCKIWLSEGGKWRTRVAIGNAAEFVARHAVHDDDIEAWGITADGEFVGEGW